MSSGTSIDGGLSLPPRNDPSAHQGDGHTDPGLKIHQIEQWLGVLEIFLHVVVILFATLELGPKFVPQPTLVWTQEVTEAPGFRTLSIKLTNESSVPLEQLEARWTLENPRVKIYVENTAPPSTFESPSPLVRVLRFSDAMAASTTFTIYLHADEPFQVSSQEFTALIPRISNFRTFTEPAEIESSKEWSEHKKDAYFKLIYTIAIVIALGFGIHKAIVRGKVAMEGKDQK